MVLLTGCGSAQSQAEAPAAAVSDSASASDSAESTAPAAAPSSTPIEPARVGSTAESSRLRFKPTQVELPGGSTASVLPAPTVDGELVVPENVDELGWWDGGAYVNDPFGSTVIAGHIDNAEGPGYFGQLLTIEVGEVVTVRGDGGELDYRVVGTELIDKEALVADSVAFNQRGDHRLVLITCSGQWRPEVHSYESNFFVIAEPIGLAQ